MRKERRKQTGKHDKSITVAHVSLMRTAKRKQARERKRESEGQNEGIPGAFKAIGLNHIIVGYPLKEF